jgi:hypothetical protein
MKQTVVIYSPTCFGYCVSIIRELRCAWLKLRIMFKNSMLLGTFGHKKREKYDMVCFIMISFIINVVFHNIVATTHSNVGLAECVFPRGYI